MRVVLLAAVLFLLFQSAAAGQKAALDSLYKVAAERVEAGNMSGATEMLMTVQKLADAAADLKMQCNVQLSLGKIGVITENNPLADAAIEKALQYCGACRDTLRLGRAYLQKGVMMAKHQQNDSAIVLFERSASYYLIGGDTAGSANALVKVGNVLELQKRYLEAREYYQKFYDVAQKEPEGFNFLNANIYLTGNSLYLDRPEDALAYNQRVLDIARQRDAKYEYGEALRNTSAIYEQMGQYPQAYDQLLHYVNFYRDTLMGQQQLDQAEEMRAKYEAEKKEAQIALQDAQLGRERTQRWMLIGGLSVALLVGGLLFRLTRQLRQRNREKEFLIKEIHHRVKNNLQILSSLLHLQSRQITDDSALHAVREGQSRVDAMGLIHQKLYMGDNVAQVEMKDYLEQYGQTMLDTFGLDDGRVEIVYDLDTMYVDLDTAIPLGLIINELVTNALKYAFPGQRQGRITIKLWQDDKNRLGLNVSDDGVGRANALADAKSTSFGASLIQMLSKKLKGRPEVLPTETGYATQILFEKYD